MKRAFLDSNFLVYMNDDDSPVKRDRAKERWNDLAASSDIAVISTQVLQEFYNALTKKLKISRPQARNKIVLLKNTETVLMTPELILAAIDLHASASLSFWDSLIIAAAQSANCDELWTEDLNPGQTFGTLKIVNPF